ncbi:MAG TPA: PIN domain-containing protein [Candidatus Limnocylindria bacterium]
MARFVDTSFWIAFRNLRDPMHAESLRVLRAAATAELVTSNHVRGETWTYLRAKVGHRAAVDFLDATERTHRLAIVSVSGELEGEALVWLRRHDERPYSFVDATSFAVMRSLGITEALTFDRDFAAAGFIPLRA